MVCSKDLGAEELNYDEGLSCMRDEVTFRDGEGDVG